MKHATSWLIITAVYLQFAGAVSVVVAQGVPGRAGGRGTVRGEEAPVPATVKLEDVPGLVAQLDREQLWISLQMHVLRKTPAKDAAAALSRLGPDAIPSLAAAGADHTNPTVRANVVYILSSYRKPEAVAALIKATKDDDAIVRQMAATGLHARNHMEAVTALLPLLSDSAANVRAAAAASLGKAAAQDKAGEPISNYEQSTVVVALAKLLPDMEPGVRSCAAIALGELKNSNGLPALVKLLETETENHVRIAIVQSLGKIDNRSAAPALIAFVGKERDSTARGLAIQSLAVIRDVRATSLLIELLSDSDDVVQLNAARALGKIGDRRATPHLIRALAAPDPFRTHAAAVEALGDIGDPAAVDALIAALKNKEAAYQAARALGELRDPRAIEPLVRTLFDADQQTVQDAAALALKKIPNPLVVRRLMEECLAAKKQGYKTMLARRTVAELTGNSGPAFAFDGDPFSDDPNSGGAIGAWWKENAKYYSKPEADKR